MPVNFKMEVNLSKVHLFDVTTYYHSVQVMRFNLKCGVQEMNLEKRLLEKRQPWKVLATNFKMDKPDSAKNFAIICQCLDYELKGTGKVRVHPKNY